MRREDLLEYRLLSLMTPDTRKIVIGAETGLPSELQRALERLQLRDWIRLVDVSLATYSGTELIRTFLVMPQAVAWFESVRPSN